MKASITLKRRIRRLLKDICRSATECDKIFNDMKLKDICKRGSESRDYLLNVFSHINSCSDQVLNTLFDNAEQKRKAEDFTTAELMLLRAIFDSASAFIDALNDDIYCIDANTLFDLKEKLGINDIV